MLRRFCSVPLSLSSSTTKACVAISSSTITGSSSTNTITMISAPLLNNPSRLLFSSSRPAKYNNSSNQKEDANKNEEEEENDFVDEGEEEEELTVSRATRKMTAKAQRGDEITQEETSSSSSSSSSLVEPLGVTRLPDLPESTRYSRLNKIVDDSRKMKIRPNSRDAVAAFIRGEAELDEVTQELLREAQAQEEEGEEEEKQEQEFQEEEEDQEAEEGSRKTTATKRTKRTPTTTSAARDHEELPYEDAEFAETILKMEVEGTIDETWQDKSQAKIEDVEEIVQVLKDARTRDITAIDVRNKTSSFDFIVVATCDSQRHMTLAAWSVSDADKWQRSNKVKRRKADEMWDVVPVGRILVNLMLESYRNEVSVERKWVVTKSMDPLSSANAYVSESRQLKMHGLWTLTMNLQDLEDFEVDYCKDVLLSQL